MSTRVVVMTRTHQTWPTDGGVMAVAPVPQRPACGASWRLTGVLPRTVVCGCRPGWPRHTAWACCSCALVVAEQCSDPSRWMSTYTPVGCTRAVAV
nr:hypothetical protein [Actinomyces sp.]